MARTGGKWEGDLPFTDAKITLPPLDVMVSGTATITRNGAFDWSLNQGSSLTNQYNINISQAVIERLGMQDDGALLENYGTGTPGNSAGGGNLPYSGNQGSPYQVSGRPPFAGSTQLNPVIGTRPKGFKATDLTFVYLISTLALTSINVQVNKTTYANNVAIAQAVLLANAANGLQTATQANPYVTKVAITPANVLFNQTDNSEIQAELVVVTPATSLFRLYRVFIHGQFNYA